MLVDLDGIAVAHSGEPLTAEVAGPVFVATVAQDMLNGTFSIRFRLTTVGQYVVCLSEQPALEHWQSKLLGLACAKARREARRRTCSLLRN